MDGVRSGGSQRAVGVFVSIDDWNLSEGVMASGLNMGSMAQYWGVLHGNRVNEPAVDLFSPHS